MKKFALTYVKDNEYHTEFVEAEWVSTAREIFFGEHKPEEGYKEVCCHQITAIEWDDRIEPFDLTEKEINEIIEAEVNYHKVSTEAKKVVSRVVWFPTLVRWIALIPLYILLIPAGILAIGYLPLMLVTHLIDRVPYFTDRKTWWLINKIFHKLGKRLAEAEYANRNIGFCVMARHAEENYPEIFSKESAEQE